MPIEMTKEQKEVLLARALGQTVSPPKEEEEDILNFNYSNSPKDLEIVDEVPMFSDPDETLKDIIDFGGEEETPEPEPEPIQEPVREVSMEERLREQALKALESRPGAPTQTQINQLKQKFGDDGVYLLALGKSDVYVFTYLTKQRWDLINKNILATNKPDSKVDPNEILKEKVVLSSVLWPKLDARWLANSKAGALNTLFEAIMMASYFLNQGQIAALTHEL